MPSSAVHASPPPSSSTLHRVFIAAAATLHRACIATSAIVHSPPPPPSCTHQYRCHLPSCTSLAIASPSLSLPSPFTVDVWILNSTSQWVNWRMRTPALVGLLHNGYLRRYAFFIMPRRRNCHRTSTFTVHCCHVPHGSNVWRERGQPVRSPLERGSARALPLSFTTVTSEAPYMRLLSSSNGIRRRSSTRLLLLAATYFFIASYVASCLPSLLAIAIGHRLLPSPLAIAICHCN
jgi:hypothetical protein